MNLLSSFSRNQRFWLGLYQRNSQGRLFAARTLAYSNVGHGGDAVGRSLKSPVSGTCHGAHEPTKEDACRFMACKEAMPWLVMISA